MKKKKWKRPRRPAGPSVVLATRFPERLIEELDAFRVRHAAAGGYAVSRSAAVRRFVGLALSIALAGERERLEAELAEAAEAPPSVANE
jgi:hypothetical protein